MIRTLEQMEEKVLMLGKRHRVAVAWAQDPNTINAVNKAVSNGLIEAFLIGNPDEIRKACIKEEIDFSHFTIIEASGEGNAAQKAVWMARNGEADIVMKGLVSTDKFLREILDRENGLMLPDSVLSYVP